MSLPKYDKKAFVFVRKGGLYCREPLWPAYIVHVVRSPDGYSYMYEVEMLGHHDPRRVTVAETQIWPATKYRMKVYSDSRLNTHFQEALTQQIILSNMVEQRQREEGRAQAIPRNLLPELDRIAWEDRAWMACRRFMQGIINGIINLCRRIFFGWP